MSSPCDTCALRQDSVTWNEPYNRLRALICALVGIPFLCHHGFDYGKAHISVMNRRFVTVGVPDERELRVCVGWKRETALYKQRGQFNLSPDARLLQKQCGRHALELVDRFIDEKDEAKKQEYHEELKNIMAMLATWDWLEHAA